MYIKDNGDGTYKFPYTLNDLRREHSNVSFPAVLPSQILETFGVFEVVEQTKPSTDRLTYAVKRSMPELVDGVWTLIWDVFDKTAETIAEETELQTVEIRESRNGMLTKCDWTQLPDAALTQEQKDQWATYRQALRDLPSQNGFPWDVVWPAKPE